MSVHLKQNEPKPNPFPPASPPRDPVGIGLRHPYYEEVTNSPPNVGWLEVHPENYFGGGAHRHFLSKAREKYQLSLHAVGLSLGSTDPVSEEHLRQFKELIDIYQPFNVSDHASWSASGNAHLNDLLPLPYTKESLDTLCRNVERTQEYFGRTMLVENPSTYVAFAENEMSEHEFMNRLSEKTGCGILLDINNIFVQSHNHGLDPFEYIDGIDSSKVGEMHLAGHIEQEVGDGIILIDTHSRPVKKDVWDLYEHAVRRLGSVPTLIEWDQDFPPLSKLVEEANKARDIMNRILNKDITNAAE
ncbi:MAG: UPF0276 protein [Micavibrio sp.]|nr:MAG: UPF0276 protein [Micavibrio sp.]